MLCADPTSGAIPLIVNFDGSGSTDPDAGERLTYTFDFGDGAAPITQDSPMLIHEYGQFGTFTASLTVKNSRGFESNTATVAITVTPPLIVVYHDDDHVRLMFERLALPTVHR
jgi:PKD repeat protein